MSAGGRELVNEQQPAILLQEGFVPEPEVMLRQVIETTEWDTRMKARLTASFGVPYNYSGITYPELPFPPTLQSLFDPLERRLGFRPNNCLVNYYRDGEAKMGFHSDSVVELVEGTGVAVISLGAERTLRFLRRGDKNLCFDCPLPDGSLLYMPQEVQLEWRHGVPEQPGAGARISLTFRCLRPATGPLE